MSDVGLLGKICFIVAVLAFGFVVSGLMLGAGWVERVVEPVFVPVLLVGLLAVFITWGSLRHPPAPTGAGHAATTVLPDRNVEWCGCVTLKPSNVEEAE